MLRPSEVTIWTSAGGRQASPPASPRRRSPFPQRSTAEGIYIDQQQLNCRYRLWNRNLTVTATGYLMSVGRRVEPEDGKGDIRIYREETKGILGNSYWLNYDHRGLAAGHWSGWKTQFGLYAVLSVTTNQIYFVVAHLKLRSAKLILILNLD